MTITITLTDIKIHEMVTDFSRGSVTIKYSILDNSGKAWGDVQQETYWAVMPQLPGPSDVQLPANYTTTFLQLRDAALAALKAKYLA